MHWWGFKGWDLVGGGHQFFSEKQFYFFFLISQAFLNHLHKTLHLNSQQDGATKGLQCMF